MDIKLLTRKQILNKRNIYNMECIVIQNNYNIYIYQYIIYCSLKIDQYNLICI